MTTSLPPSEGVLSVDLQAPGAERRLAGERADIEDGRPGYSIAARYAEIVVSDLHESKDRLAPLLQDVGLDATEAAAAAAHLAAPATGPVAAEAVAGPDGWQAMDLWLFTSVMPKLCTDGCPYLLRSARVLASTDAYVCVWRDEHRAADWEAANYPIALPERLRRHSYTTQLTGADGLSEAARLIQDVLQHHEWSVKQLTYRIEEWEQRFYELAGTPHSLRRGSNIAQLRRDLSSIATANLALREATRDLARRATVAGALLGPAALRDEVLTRSEQLEQRIADIRTGVREAFVLLTGAASGAQVEFQQSFSTAATLVAAFVLIPGVVMALYGANVDGLPGFEDAAGVRYIFAFSVIGAVATLAVLNELSRRRWRLAVLWVVLAGAAITGVTLL